MTCYLHVPMLAEQASMLCIGESMVDDDELYIARRKYSVNYICIKP